LLVASDNVATVANDPIDKLRRTAYPNPERIGCPDSSIFEALRLRKVAFDDPVWTHIEHCSPCYCQFSEIRDALFKEERKSDSRRAIRAGLVIVVLLALGASFYAWRRSRANEGQGTIAANHREAAVLNFEDGSELRGAQGDSTARMNSGVQHLPRNQLNLTVYLPLGSPAGSYDLEIVSSTGDRIWHARGQATIKNGLTSIPVDGDLRNVPIGGYKFRFRRPDETWREKDVIVR
jgi:hypothetical protein